MQKTNVLADHFANVFKPYNSEMPDEEEQDLLHALKTPIQLATPVKEFKLTGLKYATKLH
jgi:hypothetical protein